eukprot:tig00000042_g15488.t1
MHCGAGTMLPRPRRDLLAAGLMSGTSVDGIDVALVRFNADPTQPLLTLMAYEEFPIEDELRRRIRRAMDPASSGVDAICALNREIAEAFAAAVQRALAGRAPPGPLPRLDFVASHGQTVHHAPRGEPPSTLQVGDGSTIAVRLGVPCVSDFRTADVAAGGSGAPLIPFVDRILLSRPDRPVVCQNIGGIANCTILPPSSSGDASVVAFDEGPGNMVMDLLLSAWGSAERFDEGGRLAARGTVIVPLLEELLTHPYFAWSPPKSTGHETFGVAFAEGLLRRARELQPEVRLEDVLAVAAELTARCIVDGVRRFLPVAWRGTGPVEVVVSGGGARNGHLMSRLGALGAPDLAFVPSDERGVPSDAKEALGFALLGYATLCGAPANVPSVTGAAGPAVLGKICPVGDLRPLLESAGTVTVGPLPHTSTSALFPESSVNGDHDQPRRAPVVADS